MVAVLLLGAVTVEVEVFEPLGYLYGEAWDEDARSGPKPDTGRRRDNVPGERGGKKGSSSRMRGSTKVLDLL